jgi:hypothetical protein
MQNLSSLFFFFANSITAPARKYDSFIYPLNNTLLIYSFCSFISSLLYLYKGTKKVYNLPLVVSYNPINDIQANRFCFRVIEYPFEFFILY